MQDPGRASTWNMSTKKLKMGLDAVYTPLSRKIEAYGRRFTVNSRLLERGLCAIAAARPLHDLRLLAERVREPLELRVRHVGEEAQARERVDVAGCRCLHGAEA